MLMSIVGERGRRRVWCASGLAIFPTAAVYVYLNRFYEHRLYGYVDCVYRCRLVFYLLHVSSLNQEECRHHDLHTSCPSLHAFSQLASYLANGVHTLGLSRKGREKKDEKEKKEERDRETRTPGEFCVRVCLFRRRRSQKCERRREYE